MMNPVLEFRNVSKHYGKVKALDEVSFQIHPGKIVGILGSNGSGKSTLMKLSSSVVRPSTGEILIDGISVGRETKEITSLMVDTPSFDSWMTVNDAIQFQQDFFQNFDTAKAKDMLDFMKLNGESRVGSLSKGMKERLQLTLAMSRNAKLYLLDEPIGGVDPVARAKILDAIVEYYSEDSSILISTHLLQDIEKIFDEVLFVKQGKLILQDDVENIRIKHRKSIDELFKEVYADC